MSHVSRGCSTAQGSRYDLALAFLRNLRRAKPSPSRGHFSLRYHQVLFLRSLHSFFVTASALFFKNWEITDSNVTNWRISLATMLAALRRCSASVPRTIASTSARSSIPRSQVARALRSSQSIQTLPSRSFSSTIRWQQQEAYAAAPEVTEATETGAEHAITRFQELADRQLIHPNVINAITNSGIETMTDVQSATINQALHGTDM